jgi:hypothetical protein
MDRHWFRRNKGGDPVWHWFLHSGHLRDNFKWHKTLPWDWALRDIDVLRNEIGEQTEADVDFPAKVRIVALEAVQSEDPLIIRMAIQALCVVGSEDDLLVVRDLVGHSDPDVATEARTCLFERKHRTGSG